MIERLQGLGRKSFTDALDVCAYKEDIDSQDSAFTFFLRVRMMVLF